MAEVKKTPAKKAPVAAKKAPAKAAAPKAPVQEARTFSGKYSYGLGKRKTAVAQVRIYEGGKGEIIVNNKEYDSYFSVGTLLGRVKSPIKMAHLEGFTISAKIAGGGVSAQADALRHGIARALVAKDASNKTLLKKAGQLTRDARIVERKKPGRRKARRGQQWVKR